MSPRMLDNVFDVDGGDEHKRLRRIFDPYLHQLYNNTLVKFSNYFTEIWAKVTRADRGTHSAFFRPFQPDVIIIEPDGTHTFVEYHTQSTCPIEKKKDWEERVQAYDLYRGNPSDSDLWEHKITLKNIIFVVNSAQYQKIRSRIAQFSSSQFATELYLIDNNDIIHRIS